MQIGYRLYTVTNTVIISEQYSKIKNKKEPKHLSQQIFCGDKSH